MGCVGPGAPAVRARVGGPSAVVPPRSEGERGGGGGSEPERSGGATAGARRPDIKAVALPGLVAPQDVAEKAEVAGPTATGTSLVAAPDPEVVETPARRRFPIAYKLEILRRVDACRRPGEIGEILRREGLYTSHLSAWRHQRDAGALRDLGGRKRGRKAKEVNPLAARLAAVEREKRKLENELRKAKTIIEIQKKVSTLLGIPLNAPELDEDD